jgi:hypothetical protein
MLALLVGVTTLCALLAGGLLWLGQRYRAQRRRFAAVVDVDDEVARQKRLIAELDERRTSIEAEAVTRLRALEAASERERTTLQAELARLRDEAERRQLATRADFERQQSIREREAVERLGLLEAEYEAGHATYVRLKRELALLQEQDEDISFGLYRPTFSFDTPEQYKVELEKVWEQQKALVRMDEATECPHEWTVAGSRAEGRKMQKQLAKLMLRAFNGETEASVARVTWNNATKMEERIRKAFEAINNLGTVVGVSITRPYLALAVKELRLTFEHEQKKQAALEEQREIRERLRDEEKALREAQRAQDEAGKEEARYEKALAKARKDLEKAKGAELAEMQTRIAQLEASLAEAHKQKERAKSMAELTKSGYVYVISNIGSFGEDVYKIDRDDPSTGSDGSRTRARRRLGAVRVRRARDGLHGRCATPRERLPPPLRGEAGQPAEQPQGVLLRSDSGDRRLREGTGTQNGAHPPRRSARVPTDHRIAIAVGADAGRRAG